MNKKQDLLFRTFFIFLAFIFLTATMPALTFADRTEELIIDHTCTDISQIPQEWLNAVKTMTLHHTGQSHGRQVPHGMDNLETEDPLYDQTQSEGGIPSGSGLKITRGQRTVYNSWQSSIGPEEYWQGAIGRAWTERTMEYHAGNGDTIHASLHTWCWHLRTWSESQVNEYLSSMEILGAEYPDVTFIYMTDTCDSTVDTGGYNRFLRNQQIRQYCRDNNKVLFDFADLEAWSADGTEQSTYYHAASGLNIPYWHSDWSSDPFYNDGHINEAACTMKAKAMWWLMARLDGWNPGGSSSANFSGTPTTGTAPLEVSFTDSSVGDIDTRSWDFDNNGIIDSTLQNPTYTYTDPGTYTVSLSVTGPGGTDTETKINYITATLEPQTPAANFSSSPRTGTAPLEVSFTDSSAGDIDTWSWDFDNNGSIDSTLQNPTYTYADTGTYTVSLQVTGPGGADTETKTDYITVQDDSGANGSEDGGGGGACFISVVAYMGNGE